MCITTGTLVHKNRLTGEKVNYIMTQKKERIMQMRISCDLRKNRSHIPSDLGDMYVGQVLWLSRKVDEFLAVQEFYKFDNYNSKAHLGCLNGFIMLITLYQ